MSEVAFVGSGAVASSSGLAAVEGDVVVVALLAEGDSNVVAGRIGAQPPSAINVAATAIGGQCLFMIIRGGAYAAVAPLARRGPVPERRHT